MPLTPAPGFDYDPDQREIASWARSHGPASQGPSLLEPDPEPAPPVEASRETGLLARLRSALGLG